MTGRRPWIRIALRLAAREGRHSIRRVGPYMVSITLGVAALVAIHSFRADVERSLASEAEVLMGANARLSGDRPWSDTIQAVRDSLSTEDRASARVTTASSMVLAVPSDVVRLMQVRAIDPGYPFYGSVRTTPDGLWGAHLEPGQALVDPAVLPQLEAEIGDTILVGQAALRIVGTVDDLPTDLGFQTAVGPRIHISHQAMDEAQLLGFGSLARYEIFFVLPDAAERSAFDDRYDELFSEARLRFTLAEQQARSLSRGVGFLARFLALVGLGALLLGGIGVASAIHVYVQEKRTTVAVLRCLGADQKTTFLVYLTQAAALGALGAGAGVLLGTVLQQALPTLLGGFLPVPVSTQLAPASAAAGLGIGIWVAVIFALLPLLSVLDVTPLQALRADIEPGRGSRALHAARSRRAGRQRRGAVPDRGRGGRGRPRLRGRARGGRRGPLGRGPAPDHRDAPVRAQRRALPGPSGGVEPVPPPQPDRGHHAGAGLRDLRDRPSPRSGGDDPS
jgi:putative ABC transport system permease protein